MCHCLLGSAQQHSDTDWDGAEMAALAWRMSAVPTGWNFCFQFPHGIHLQGVFLLGRKESVDKYWIHPCVFQKPCVAISNILADLFFKSGDFSQSSVPRSLFCSSLHNSGQIVFMAKAIRLVRKLGFRKDLCYFILIKFSTLQNGSKAHEELMMQQCTLLNLQNYSYVFLPLDPAGRWGCHTGEEGTLDYLVPLSGHSTPVFPSNREANGTAVSCTGMQWNYFYIFHCFTQTRVTLPKENFVRADILQ